MAVIHHRNASHNFYIFFFCKSIPFPRLGVETVINPAKFLSTAVIISRFKVGNIYTGSVMKFMKMDFQFYILKTEGFLSIKKAAIFISLQKLQQFIGNKRLPFKCHCHSGESTMTIQRTPHSQKGHHQISTANLPSNMQRNFIIKFNTQYVKHHIGILS